jgi:phosphatidylglycerophosphatase A
MKNLVVWIAQGFGIGRIPFAPGTFGSAVGLVWFAFLLSTPSPWFAFAGVVLSSALAIWICGAAEKVLKQTDPSSIVLDEIVAMPLCFVSLVVIRWASEGVPPDAQYFFSAGVWPITVGVFLLFRLFDILKPWPLRLSQSAPGGVGVVLDDLLAALYVNAIVLLLWGTGSVGYARQAAAAL